MHVAMNGDHNYNIGLLLSFHHLCLPKYCANEINSVYYEMLIISTALNANKFKGLTEDSYHSHHELRDTQRVCQWERRPSPVGDRHCPNDTNLARLACSCEIL